MNAPRVLRVVHVINGLGVGGAETMLYRILAHRRPSVVDARVVSLSKGGALASRVRELGVPVEELDLRGPAGLLTAVPRLRKVLRAANADLVQTWMYHADLLGGLAARWERIPTVWGIQNTNLLWGTSKWSTRLIVRFLALLSRVVPRRIVSCSREAERVHVAKGYDQSKFVVVPNGSDTVSFFRSASKRGELRARLGIAPVAMVVGHVGRFHPQKDHRTFLRAAGLLGGRRPAPLFLMCGEGVGPDNAELRRVAGEAGIERQCLFLGPREDMAAVMNALDVLAVSARAGEAFPLVLGEAMACEVPCVTTNVGDASFLVGDTGRTVPVGDPAALATALAEILEMPTPVREQLGARARARIAKEFSIERIARLYEDLYLENGKESR